MPIRINNQTLRLGDMADVTMTYQDPSHPQFYYEGKPAIGIAISMDAGGNNIEFGEAIDKKLAELKKTIPAGLNSTKCRISHILLRNPLAISRNPY